MNLSLLGSKVYMRLGLWRMAATLLARMPLVSLDATARGRLSYALLMLHRTDPAAARHLLTGLLAANADAAAPLLLECATMAMRVQNEPLANGLLTHALATATPMGDAAATQDAVATQDAGATQDAAGTLLALHTSNADGTLLPHIASLVDAAHLPPTGLLTLVPVSSRYLDLWALWIAQTRQHIGGTVVALALDDATLAALAAEPDVAVVDARAFFAWQSPGSLHDLSRGVLWQIRTLVLRDLLWRGRTVLVLDLDAIAVGTLQPLLDSLPAADVIAQEDHSIPMDVDRQLGFILCCGFMLWRPTPAAQSLVTRFAAETLIERDDQLALNHILGREGITHRTTTAGCMHFQSAGASFACPPPAQVSRTLHSGALVRHFQQEGHTVAQLRQALGLS